MQNINLLRPGQRREKKNALVVRTMPVYNFGADQSLLLCCSENRCAPGGGADHWAETLFLLPAFIWDSLLLGQQHILLF